MQAVSPFPDEKHPRLILYFTVDFSGVIQPAYDFFLFFYFFEGDVIEQIHFKAHLHLKTGVYQLKELFLKGRHAEQI